MGENSAISWTDHTFNPFIGCTRVSPACDGCYAAELMGKDGGRFKRVAWGGPGKGEGERIRTSPITWRLPRKWNRASEGAPGKTFVFCASLADVFDNAVPAEWRRDLFDLIRSTPNLTWLLLTKRPGNIVKLWSEAVRPCTGHAEARKFDSAPEEAWPRNAAIGCTVINQEEADRDIPKLLAAKAALNPAFAFLSMEPLLGPVDLRQAHIASERLPRVDWVIAGGETDQGAHKARPADPAWFRSLRDQCAAAGVPFHFKQWGEWHPHGQCLSDGAVNCLGNPDDARGRWHGFDGEESAWRVGKDRAGRFLDGAGHDARPL